MTNDDKKIALWYTLSMKLSQYAKAQGISYRTALRWWKAGQIKGYQAETGTIIVEEGKPEEASIVHRVAIYARVSSREHQPNLERQRERLEDYCAAKGYQIATVVKEIASGVNDARPKFLALLRDTTITTIVIEHKDRATRFGFRYLETLLELQGRGFEVVNLAENNQEDLLVDLTSILYSFMARLYGQRRGKRKTEKIVQELEAEDAVS
ncbi:MAG: IS607-like element IS1602 family transposase [Ktedonobacteraceae bacterium]